MNDIVYRIDAQDSIRFVNPAWDRFAQENADARMGSDAVVGSSLWDHIHDHTSRELYRKILAKVRDRGDFRFALRCDSPTLRRRLEMRIKAAGGGSVEFRTHELSVEPRAEQTMFDPTVDHAGNLVLVCSWCNRLDVEGRWLEVEDAVQELGLFERDRMPHLSHGICPACFERVSLALDG